ncbi:dUTP diphosphatase, partial [Anaerotruncus sp. X29]|nr:dUTP diphosphatase [Anaerotruncus sp. X29]
LHIELVNSVGVIDGDYYNNPNNEGEIFLQFRNLTAAPLTIEANTSIGQVVFMPLLLADGDSFENGEERVGGFGSTNK